MIDRPTSSETNQISQRITLHASHSHVVSTRIKATELLGAEDQRAGHTARESDKARELQLHAACDCQLERPAEKA